MKNNKKRTKTKSTYAHFLQDNTYRRNWDYDTTFRKCTLLIEARRGAGRGSVHVEHVWHEGSLAFFEKSRLGYLTDYRSAVQNRRRSGDVDKKEERRQ